MKSQGQAPLILVLVPTRELALQTEREANRLKNSPEEYRVLPIYGGVDINRQIQMLKKGVEIVVGTPGRIIDLLTQNILFLHDVKVLYDKIQ